MANQWQQPPYQQQYPQQRGYPPQGRPWPPPGYRPPERSTITYQHGSTGFHIFMTCITCGLWLPVWLASRRKVRRTVRYY